MAEAPLTAVDEVFEEEVLVEFWLWFWELLEVEGVLVSGCGETGG